MNEDIEVLDFEEANDEKIETLDENDNKSEVNKEINGNDILNKQQKSNEMEGTIIDINRLFDVDDLILNTLGGLLGYFLNEVFSLIYGLL